MRILTLASALVAPALVSAHPITEFRYDGGAFFETPFHAEQWIQVDDAKQTCWLMHNDFGNQQEAEGARTYDSRRDLHFFLSVTGAYYQMTSGDATWSYVAPGTIGGGTQWTRTLKGTTGDTQVFLGWTGQQLQFVNDPRAEEGQTSKVWYQLGPGQQCHTFTEASRSYGPADLQTVTLQSEVPGLPVWKLTNGRAALGSLVEKGNWSAK